MSQLLNIPLVRQSFDYSCGAGSVASVLYYWGVWEGREPELYEALGTTSEYGTSGEGVISVLRSYGLSVSYEVNMTVERLSQLSRDGYTVILSIQAWGNYTDKTDWMEVWDDGHYVVMVGIKGDLVYMMDPSIAIRYGVMGIDEFERRWHDWSDDGESCEYHTGIIVKGDKVLNTNELVKIS